MNDFVKIFFEVNNEFASTESCWAIPLKKLFKTYYKVNNFLFFRKGVAFDDIVKARRDQEYNGHLVFTGIKERSGNSLLQLKCREEERAQEIRKILSTKGCDSELGYPLFGFAYVALNIPKDIDIKPIFEWLHANAVEYVEAYISDHHRLQKNDA